LLTEKRPLAFALILISLCSDAIDGWMARRLHQESDLGKFLDPLCDKISLAVILICLWIIGSIPLWCAMIIISRDILILLGGYILIKEKQIIPKSNILGKITGVCFGITILAFTINLKSIGMVFLCISIPLMFGALISYARQYFSIMKGDK
jgi:CDP-diacylglycerol--glycerol-3-phosphate 3-phosphatidyltransferase